MQQITIKDIKEDIAAFEARISAAQTKLDMLPDGFLPISEHKRREKQRKDLLDEIDHVKRLLGYAREAL